MKKKRPQHRPQKQLTDREALDSVLKQRDELQAELRRLKAKERARRDPLMMTPQLVSIDIDNSTEGPTGAWRNIYRVDGLVVPTHAETAMGAILATAEYPRGTRVRLMIESRLVMQNTMLLIEGFVK